MKKIMENLGMEESEFDEFQWSQLETPNDYCKFVFSDCKEERGYISGPLFSSNLIYEVKIYENEDFGRFSVCDLLRV